MGEAEQLRERFIPLANPCVGAAVRIAPLLSARPKAITWPFWCLVSVMVRALGSPSAVEAFSPRSDNCASIPPVWPQT